MSRDQKQRSFHNQTPFRRFRWRPLLPQVARRTKRILGALIIASISCTTAQQIIVKPGDTLSSIAQRYNTTVERLLQLNKLKSPTINTNDTLTISTDSPHTLVVQRGDTLQSIAKRFGLSVTWLSRINALDKSATLYSGDVLLVPTNDDAVVQIVVHPEDTLGGIAERFDITFSELLTFNELGGEAVHVGDVLQIPLKRPAPPLEKASPAVAQAVTPAYGHVETSTQPLLSPTRPVIPEGELVEITIAYGDTLSTIARTYGVSVQAIMEVNNLISSHVQTGEVLKLPLAKVPPVPEAAPIAVQPPLEQAFADVESQKKPLSALKVGNEALLETLAPQAEVVESSPEGTRHIVTVQYGDTLSSLATHYGVSIRDIMQVNNRADTRLAIGERLVIITPYELYTIQWGDTASEIASRYAVGLHNLLEVNELDNTHIAVGEVLKIPVSIEPLTSSSQNQTAQIPLEDDLLEVVVQPNDTLGEIAAEYGLNVGELMALNTLTSTRIRVGDVLLVRAPEPAPEELDTLTVQSGETLSELAIRYGTTTQALVRANQLSSVYIRAGDTLVLPRNAHNLKREKIESYTVKQGDVLYSIAQAFDIPLEKLIAINSLTSHLIYEGQVLSLSAPEEVREPLQIAIAPGDTLGHIASRYDISIDVLAQANDMSALELLKVGEFLTIPDHYAGDEVMVAAVPETKEIAVVRGDTLSILALRHNTTVEAIMAANNLTSHSIAVGQMLTIAAGAQDDVATISRSAVAQARPKPTDLGAGEKIAWPLKGIITSPFGYRNLVINGRNYRQHTGLDIDGDTGDPITAAAPGVVTFSGWKGGYGQLVIIESGSYEYYYAHCSELLVSQGQGVTVGQMIAKVGSTGASTGSHLHFEVRIDNTPKNPMLFLQ